MPSPFLDLPPERHVAENELAFAIRDGFAVSPGHTLVIPKREIATWFEATEAEQHAILRLVEVVRRALDIELRPDGYNIGWNIDTAAGQTVMHLHVHVIPRYHGDMPDPRGGVRHVIPAKGNYLADAFEPAGPRHGALTTGGADDHLLHHIQPLFAEAQDIAILAAFVQHKGVEELEPLVLAAARRGARVRLVTGDYLHITQKDALEAMLGWMALDVAQPPEVRVVETSRLKTHSRSFHPKSWIFLAPAFGTAFVGSSNVSRAALRDGIEWNLRVDRSRDRSAFQRVTEAFDAWWLEARPLDAAFLHDYRDRVFAADLAPPLGEVLEERLPLPPEPHEIQLEALAELAAARQAGRQRALVVLATGLGKTWLAAFDVQAHAQSLGRTPRLLFLAHRDELLRQAARTFASQFPGVDYGFFAGGQGDLDSTFVFASVQKLSLKAHLSRLAERHFDYVVIDEVHHATADSYRRVLNALRATFVLGLTATPDRADQADVLGLFDDHLAFRADIAVGIQAQRLAPFHYFGLKDPADYRPIPWRNGRFDPETLAVAVQTQARMDKAWQGWNEHPGTRTLVFCCTIAHARFVCAWLTARGVRIVAVHSEADSADRHDSLERLTRGELDAVCAVDLFNEGIDVPTVDRVVMLRPSESPVVFLQQLGRGLRRAEGKNTLTVLDFVGNHRVFLNRLRSLLDMAPEGAPRQPLAGWLAEAARREATVLPPGCSIQIDLEAIDLLAALLPKGEKNALVQTFRELVQARGLRPTAGELFRLGLNPRVKDGWFPFVADEQQLDPQELEALQGARAWLADLERTPMTKSFKMVTLQALIEADALSHGMPLDELCQRSHALLLRSPELLHDLESVRELADPRQPDPAVWRAYWRKNPIAAWLGESADKQKKPWFTLDNDRFVPRLQVASQAKPALARMVAELVDWRLAEYRSRVRSTPTLAATAFECKLNHNGTGPILMLPERAKVPGVPMGETPVRLPDGRVWMFRFVKVACNVATVPGDAQNRLPELLRGWFGPLAGQPGTQHRVRLRPTSDGWRIEPVALGDAQVIPLPNRVRLRAFMSLRAAAGWAVEAHDATDLSPDGEVSLPGPIPDGCFALRASGESMQGWRSEICDGDWLVCKPLQGADFGAVEGQIAIVARGEAEARSFHVKRPVRDGLGRWWLRSDNPEVEVMVALVGDVPVASVVRVVRGEEFVE